MNTQADVIVAGIGGAGASALYHSARRGLRVIGLDRFAPGHDRGSSHGETRVIRQAYFEHPDYVPLLQRAYALWRDLEDESSESLLHLCGLLMVGPEDGEIIAGSRLAAARYGLPLEQVDEVTLREQFPALRIPEDAVTDWEPSGGYLDVEACVRAYARLAVRHGATIRTGETVLDFATTPSGVTVETDRADPERHEVCMYTMTEDAHFVLDRHPEHDRVFVAGGFSGHGFKFMSAIGAVLAEFAIDGESETAVGFLGLSRFPG